MPDADLGPAPGHGSARVEGAVQTPTAWRVAAAAFLVGPFVVGFVAERRLPPWISAIGAIAVPAAILRSVSRAPRRLPITPAPVAAAGLPSVSVVIAARDEAAVIANIIGDIGSQDLFALDPVPNFELVVIDDRSTDGTGEIARRAAMRAGIGDRTKIVRRSGEGLANLKSGALASVPPEAFQGDVLVHLDADGRVEPPFLQLVLRYAAAGVPAMTATRRVLARPGFLAGGQADEAVADGALLELRWASGTAPDFRGNGSVIRRDLLREIGGWPAALSEDGELATTLMLSRGVAVAHATDAIAWEEPVLSLNGIWHQRVRWAEGTLRRAFRFMPDVLLSRRVPLAARVEFGLYAAQATLPAALLGAAAGRRRRIPAASVAILMGFWIFQGSLTWLGLEHELGPGRGSGGPAARRARRVERLRRAVRGGLFSAVWWLGTMPMALWLIATRRGPVGFRKMDHVDTSWGPDR